MTIFLKVEHKNNKADIIFETSIFKHTLIYIGLRCDAVFSHFHTDYAYFYLFWSLPVFKRQNVSMQMKPYIPSKEWYICFSSRKTNEYATDKKLKGSACIQPFFTHITRIIIYFDHFRFSKDKHISIRMKPCIPSKEWYICFSYRKNSQ